MKRTSKRGIAFFLTLVLMLSFCACAEGVQTSMWVIWFGMCSLGTAMADWMIRLENEHLLGIIPRTSCGIYC